MHLALLSMVLSAGLSCADFYYGPVAPEELAAQSDIVARGRLINLRFFAWGSKRLKAGEIHVVRALWGPVDTGKRLLLIWRDPGGSGEFDFTSASIQDRIWCVRSTSVGYATRKSAATGSDKSLQEVLPSEFADLPIVVAPQHPSYAAQMALEQQVEEAVRAPSVVAHSVLETGDGSDPGVELVFRNGTDQAVTFPKVDIDDDRLRHSRNISIEVEQQRPYERGVGLQPPASVPPRSGRIEVVEPDGFTFGIPPRSEHRVTLRLTKFFELENGSSYSLQCAVNGKKRSRKTWVRFTLPTPYCNGAPR